MAREWKLVYSVFRVGCYDSERKFDNALKTQMPPIFTVKLSWNRFPTIKTEILALATKRRGAWNWWANQFVGEKKGSLPHNTPGICLLIVFL